MEFLLTAGLTPLLVPVLGILDTLTPFIGQFNDLLVCFKVLQVLDNSIRLLILSSDR